MGEIIGTAKLIPGSDTHGAGGSSADYEVDPPLDGCRRVRVSVHWGTVPDNVRISDVVPPYNMVASLAGWESWSFVWERLGYTGDAFPLRNNPYLGWDYRKSMGWLSPEQLALWGTNERA